LETLLRIGSIDASLLISPRSRKSEVSRVDPFFIVNDRGEAIETEVVGSDDKQFKHVPSIQIGVHPQRPLVGMSRGLDESGVVETKGRPWFADESNLSGLEFPFEATRGKVRISFYDYRLFHVSSVVKELD
jgi:hypothetical protein